MQVSQVNGLTSSCVIIDIVSGSVQHLPSKSATIHLPPRLYGILGDRQYLYRSRPERCRSLRRQILPRIRGGLLLSWMYIPFELMV